MQAIFFSFLHSLVVANLKVMDAANAFFFVILASTMAKWAPFFLSLQITTLKI